MSATETRRIVWGDGRTETVVVECVGDGTFAVRRGKYRKRHTGATVREAINRAYDWPDVHVLAPGEFTPAELLAYQRGVEAMRAAALDAANRLIVRARECRDNEARSGNERGMAQAMESEVTASELHRDIRAIVVPPTEAPGARMVREVVALGGADTGRCGEYDDGHFRADYRGYHLWWIDDKAVLNVGRIGDFDRWANSRVYEGDVPATMDALDRLLDGLDEKQGAET